MASTLTWSNLNTIFTATGPAYLRGKMEEIVFEAHPFLEKIRANGNIKDSTTPGVKLVKRIRVGTNPTIALRSTRDIVPVADTETMTTAQFNWGSLTGSVSFFDEDLHDNMGEAQMVDLIQPALDQAVDTWTEIISRCLIDTTSANSAFQILGLKDAVADGSIVRPPDYGGLTPALYPGWASAVTASNGLASLVDDLNHVYNSASYGSKQPDMVWTTQRGEELYRSAMDTNIRYTDTATGDGTINAVTFRGKPVLFDRELTIQTATPTTVGGGSTWTAGTNDTASTHRFYLLNSKFWDWNFDSQWNLENAIEKQWRIPTNQFNRAKLIAIRCQLVCTQRRYQGLLTSVPTS